MAVLPPSLRKLAPLLMASLLASGLRAHAPENRPRPGSPPYPDRYLVAVEEGSPWGEHRLYLRLFPPGRGVVAALPAMAGSLTQASGEPVPVQVADGVASANNIAAFEVPEVRHAPARRPAGWAELGPIPADGTYLLRVSAGHAGSRLFELVLGPELLELRPLPPEDPRSGDGNLEVGVARAARLSRNAFTYRFEGPHGFLDRDMVRQVWERTLLGTPGLMRLGEPESPLSDGEFESWLESGTPLWHARDPAALYQVMEELAVETGAQVVLRWYGGLVWDLREIRKRVWPTPDCLPNLDYVIPPHLR